MKKPDKLIFEQYFQKLSVDELLGYLKKYNFAQEQRVKEQISQLRHREKQTKIEVLYPDITCPFCGSTNYVKNGARQEMQKYICKNCQGNYTLTTNTFMDGTTWTWEVWVRFVHMIINSNSLDDMIDTLEKDFQLPGISRMSVFLARHKLIHAMSLMPKPTLSGVIQADETFFRENQKGTRTDMGKKLINVIPQIVDRRLPRYGR